MKHGLKFSWAKPLLRAYPDAQIFLVGGMVRDILLRRPSKDVDLVVRGVPLEDLISFLETYGSVDVVGKTFGVIKFAPQKGGAQIDIALPRTEVPGGTGAYRDVEVYAAHTLPIEKDLARRDFTINAIALDLATDKLIDPFGGRADLRAKKLRAVGKPAERFQEDYTRILRGLRFACQLNFAIEPKTAAAMKKLMPRVNDVTKNGERLVPYELVGREFMKSLIANPARFMELWDKFGAFATVAPELLTMHKCPQPKNYHSEGDVWKHTVVAVSNLHGTPYRRFIKLLPRIYKAPLKATPTQYIATLLHDVAKPLTIQTPKKDGVDRIRFTGHDVVGGRVGRQIMERLKLSSVEGCNVDVDLAVWLIDHHLLAVQADVADLKETTIEKYFVRDLNAGRELLTMLFSDGSATIPSAGFPKKKHVHAVLARVKKLLRGRGPMQKVIEPLLDGTEIMSALKIAPGPRVGELLELLREAQLSGKLSTKLQAIDFLKKQ